MTDVFKDSTSHSFFFELVDSTTGLPKTGILYTDVTGSYVRVRSARVAITLATLASASAAFSSGGFILVDDTKRVDEEIMGHCISENTLCAGNLLAAIELFTLSKR